MACRPDLSITEGDAARLIPTGAGFATEWSAFLGRRYRGLEGLQNSWGIKTRDEIPDFDEAALLVPLWEGAKGVEAFYDRHNGHRLAVNTLRSNFWGDLNAFKQESVRGYMSDLAVVLKQAIADVPIVYRSSGRNTLFANLPPDIAFDGIGDGRLWGGGRPLITQGGAGDVAAQAAESLRPIWLPVTATADAVGANKTARGYATRQSLSGDFATLWEVGVRGFYVDGVRVTDPDARLFDLSEAPEQLAYLSGYKLTLETPEALAEAQQAPSVLFYPRGFLAGPPRELPHGIWWLPTDRPSTLYDFGPLGKMYGFRVNNSPVYYLYNPSGEHRVQIRIPRASRDPGMPRVLVSRSANPDFSKRGDSVAFTVGPEPVEIRNLNGSLPVPLETVGLLIDEGEKMVKVMRSHNVLDGPRFKEELSMAKIHGNPDQAYATVDELQKLLTQMRGLLQPFRWIEAEDARTQTFDGKNTRAGREQRASPDRRAPSGGRARCRRDLHDRFISGHDLRSLGVGVAPGAALVPLG